MPDTKKTSGGSLFAGLFVLVALCGGGWVYAQTQKSADPKTARNERPIVVQTATVGKGDRAITLTAIGTVTPLTTVTIKTQIAGKIMEVGFQEGQAVQAGDFLAQIDPRPYENALADAEGQLTKDQALLKEASLNLERYRKLDRQDSIAKQQVDTQESLVQQYQGTTKSDEASVATAKLNLSYCKIVSPIAGRVGLRTVDPGNYVQASDSTGIVTVTQVQPISVLFTLPEDNVPALTKRLKEGAVTVDVYDRAQDKKLASGTLAALNNQIDTTTGTIKLRAVFPNEDASLFPNQFVNVRLAVERLPDATLVPSVAVQHGTNGAFVYVVHDGKSVVAQPIKTGPDDGATCVVTEGVQPGEAVVVDGLDKLRDGAAVSVAGAETEK
jgi:multidrug efflux system membrane fusion protein